MDNITVGNRIRELRHSTGLTLQQLAEQADVSWQHLGDVERGTKRGGALFLFKIGKALNCGMDYLIAGEEKRHHAALHYMVDSLSEEQARIAGRVLRALMEDDDPKDS